MSQAAPESVDQYIASQPESVREILERVRRTLRRAMPGAEEGISYKMPAYKLEGRVVLYFAAWKKYFSIYPATATVVAEFADDVAPYFDHKSTLRFPFSDPVPVKLIQRIAKFRAKEVSGLEMTKMLPRVKSKSPRK